jgi:general secretion pathway protein L
MPTWIGIDIGTTSIKVAALKTSYRKVALAGLGAATLQPDADVPAAIRAAVREAVGEKGGAGDGIAAAIDGTKAAVRNLLLPASAQKQLAEVLPFELDGEIPFEIAESVFDHRLVTTGRAEEPDPTKIEVLVCVARVEDVRARIDLVKSAVGAEPERVGVGGFPIANLVPHVTGLAEDTVMIIDIGTKSTDVLVLAMGEPVFERTLSYGAHGVPETAPKLARELRATVNAYRAQGGKAPVRAYLCGGGAFTTGAAGYLGAELQIPVDLLPAPTLDIAGLAPEQLLDLPRFAKALGLAVGLTGRAIGFDMRKGPLSFERGFAWIKDKIPVLAGLGAVIAVSFFFSAGSQLYARSHEHATLEKALETVSQEVLGKATTSSAEANDLLNQMTATSDEDPMPHADAFDVMVRISEAIPQSVVHDIEELDVQKGHVVVHGIAGTIPEAQSIATSLQTERCFSDVKITRFNQVVGGERQKYVMEFDLKCPEDVKGGKKSASGASSGAASASGGK